MNKERRKELGKALELIASAKENVSGAREIVESVMSDEQDAFDCMPESLQETERGEAMQENIDQLESVMDELESIEDTLEEQAETINEVVER